MRERLIELLESTRYWGSGTSEEIADYLLANGVIVPKCKVGDMVYVVDKGLNVWWKGYVIACYASGSEMRFTVELGDGDVIIYEENETFLTKEEAEQALQKEGGE